MEREEGCGLISMHCVIQDKRPWRSRVTSYREDSLLNVLSAVGLEMNEADTGLTCATEISSKFWGYLESVVVNLS